MTLHIRWMAPADIAASEQIAVEAYPLPQSSPHLDHELRENGLSRYIVAESVGDGIVGFGGMWCIVEQAHIITIAVRPLRQGQGCGRALLHALIELSRRERMREATLEVRPTNGAALTLYREYGFYKVGERRSYYPDGESALILTTEPLASPAYRDRFRRLTVELNRRIPELVIELGRSNRARTA